MNFPKIIAAAATAASTAFWASTFAMETATAATFTYRGMAQMPNRAELTIESETAASIEVLLGEALEYRTESWIVKLGEETLTINQLGNFILWEREAEEQRGVVLSRRLGSSPEGIFLVWSEGRWLDALSVADWEAVAPESVPEPSGIVALGVLGLGAVASRLRRRSK